MEILERRKKLPLNKENLPNRRRIRKELKTSLKEDREQWWTQIATELENAGNLGNFQKVFEIIRKTDPKRMFISECITDKNGGVITNLDSRLDHWAEYFEEQFG